MCLRTLRMYVHAHVFIDKCVGRGWCLKGTLTGRFQGSIWGCLRHDGRKCEPEECCWVMGSVLAERVKSELSLTWRPANRWEEKADGQIHVIYMYIYLSGKDDREGGRDTQGQTEEGMLIRCEHWLASPGSVVAWLPHFFPSLSGSVCFYYITIHPILLSGTPSSQIFTSLMPWCLNIIFQFGLTPENTPVSKKQPVLIPSVRTLVILCNFIPNV